jgi:DNA-directed RNA polymerase subunit M/transcription elongation factor TFIIS
MGIGDKMVKCPKCGNEEGNRTIKSWTLTNPKSPHKLKVSMILCVKCGKKFRQTEKIA